MSIASLVLGIVAIIISWIPIIGLISFALVITGLVLGIVDVSKKTKLNQKAGIGIAGIVVNAIAIPIIVITSIISLGVITAFIIDNNGITDRSKLYDYERRIDEDEFYDDIYDRLEDIL